MNKIILISVSGLFVTGLVGLSGYLLYSNAQLRAVSAQPELATEVDTSSASSTPETGPKIGAKPTVQQTVTASTKTSSGAEGSASEWSAFIDELIVLEGDFFADYTTVDFVADSQSAVAFEQKANAQARVTLETILRKSAQAKLLFPSQVVCLNKEIEAFEKYRIVLDHSDTLLAYTSETLKIAESNEKIESKSGVVSFKIENSTDQSEIPGLMLEMQPLLQELKTHLQKVNTIIAFGGVRDFIQVVDAASAFYQKYAGAFSAGDYSGTGMIQELAVMQETSNEAMTAWSEQFADWEVANIDIPIAAAEKVYTQSENVCEAD